MSESSDRLAHTRLAIIEHIQKKQENRTSLRDRLRSVAAMAGFGRSSEQPAPAARDSGLPDFTRSSVVTSPADTRRALASEVAAEHATEARIAAADVHEEAEALRPGVPGNDPASRKARRAQRVFGDRMGPLGEAAAAYWKHHPLRLALELATPTLSRFAQRRPVAFLAASAAAGAVIYVARPWRLISVTGLALAALRSPQVSGALIGALYGDRDRDRDIDDLPD
jgi:hypothetical protein